MALKGKKITVVMPAYNAEITLRRTVAELDRDVVDEVLLVDDASTDHTVAEALRLEIQVKTHPRNRGYGGNQKTCYQQALDNGADIIVMLHPDYQYSPKLVSAMAAMIAYGEYDFVLGSRVLAQSAVEGGMPRYKYFSNRVLTMAQNLICGTKLSEFHTGLRAYSSDLLRALPFEFNSDDFVFDNQVIMQAIAAGAKIGELSCPTRYADDSSSINFWRSVSYGVGVLRSSVQYRLHVAGVGTNRRSHRYLRVDPFRPTPAADEQAVPMVARPTGTQ